LHATTKFGLFWFHHNLALVKLGLENFDMTAYFRNCMWWNTTVTTDLRPYLL